MSGLRPSLKSPAVRCMRRLPWAAKLACVGVPLLSSQGLCAAAALGLIPTSSLLPVLGACLALFGASVYLGLAFHTSVRGSHRLLEDGIRSVSGGRTSRTVESSALDEVDAINAAAERSSERLALLVAELRSKGTQISMHGQGVTRSSEWHRQLSEQLHST